MNFNVDPETMTPVQRVFHEHLCAARAELVEVGYPLFAGDIDFVLVYTDPTGYKRPVRAIRIITLLKDEGTKALLTDCLESL